MIDDTNLKALYQQVNELKVSLGPSFEQLTHGRASAPRASPFKRWRPFGFALVSIALAFAIIVPFLENTPEPQQLQNRLFASDLLLSTTVKKADFLVLKNLPNATHLSAHGGIILAPSDSLLLNDANIIIVTQTRQGVPL